MTATAHHDELRERAVDRLRETTSIGAGHAAGALATLLGRPFVMGVPEARAGSPGAAPPGFVTPLGAPTSEWAAILFEVSGGPGGLLALFLTPSARDVLLEDLIGTNAAPEHAESALCEVGNIVASHALSAVGDLLHTIVLPSPPEYVAAGGAQAFAQRVAERAGAQPTLCIEIELSDRRGEVRALLVWAPEAAEPARQGNRARRL